MENKETFKDGQFVSFVVGTETFAVEISKVKEIITMQPITTVPQTSEFIKGIINLRGKVVPIFNIKKRFLFEEDENNQGARIIVLDFDDEVFGVIVDAVKSVVPISQAQVELPSGLMTKGGTENFLDGIAKVEDQLISLLNLEATFLN